MKKKWTIATILWPLLLDDSHCCFSNDYFLFLFQYPNYTFLSHPTITPFLLLTCYPIRPLSLFVLFSLSPNSFVYYICIHTQIFAFVCVYIHMCVCMYVIYKTWFLQIFLKYCSGHWVWKNRPKSILFKYQHKNKS